MLTTTIVVICTVAAFVAGFIDSIAGGGGLITMPAMLLTGVPPHFALGTGKFATSFGTSLALINFARGNFVLWRFAFWGILFALTGSYAGTLIALQIDANMLGKIMVGLLPVGILATLLPKKERPENNDPLTNMQFWIYVPLITFIVGLYDGFFGPGAGSFYIIAFHWVLRINLLQASATSKVFNLASNVGSLVGFLISGKVLFALGIPMAGANMAGNWLGSRMAMRIGPSIIRKVLSISLSLLFVSLLLRYL